MMTAAMAFFSIALTLNLTGVRLTDLRLANLRPSAVRSFMERRLTMASTPIIRYYDHLRLVYEVESRMRELRRTTQGEGTGNQQQPNGAQPARRESQNRARLTKMEVLAWTLRSSRASRRPNDSLTIWKHPSRFRTASTGANFRQGLSNGRLHSGGSAKARRERSTVWTA